MSDHGDRDKSSTPRLPHQSTLSLLKLSFLTRSQSWIMTWLTSFDFPSQELWKCPIKSYCWWGGMPVLAACPCYPQTHLLSIICPVKIKPSLNLHILWGPPQTAHSAESCLETHFTATISHPENCTTGVYICIFQHLIVYFSIWQVQVLHIKFKGLIFHYLKCISVHSSLVGQRSFSCKKSQCWYSGSVQRWERHHRPLNTGL